MGNCMEVFSRSWEAAETEEDHEQQQKMEEREGEANEERESSGGCEKKGGMRIKVVLTKEELQWLMCQIKERGGKSLEQVLEEIERGRRRQLAVEYHNQNSTWKPSLESIMECPEVADPMDREKERDR